MAKRSTFNLNGKEVKGKNTLVLEIVKQYVERNPAVTVAGLKKIFNEKTLLRGGQVITLKADAEKDTANIDDYGSNYFLKDAIRLANGEEVVVWCYWPDRFFKPFIEMAKDDLGYKIEELESAENGEEDKKNNKVVKKLYLHCGDGYQVNLIPVVGEDSNEIVDSMIDDGNIDYDTEADVENNLCEDGYGDYRICINFYKSDEDGSWNLDGEELEDVEEDSIDIMKCKSEASEEAEDCGEELDDHYFKMISKMEKPEGCLDFIGMEIFNDIKALNGDEHVDTIKDAICRRMKQIANDLEKKGLIDKASNARFILRVGTTCCCDYSFNIETDGEFDSSLFHTLDCTDWVDCDVSDVLQEHWPDRLADYVIYDGKFYFSQDGGIDDYDYQADIVDCDLNSLL